MERTYLTNQPRQAENHARRKLKPLKQELSPRQLRKLTKAVRKAQKLDLETIPEGQEP